MDSIADKHINGDMAAQESHPADDNGRPPIDDRTRTLMAVGDLHGDYYRLLRYFR